jgi:hypothetical protein
VRVSLPGLLELAISDGVDALVSSCLCAESGSIRGVWYQGSLYIVWSSNNTRGAKTTTTSFLKYLSEATHPRLERHTISCVRAGSCSSAQRRPSTVPVRCDCPP